MPFTVPDDGEGDSYLQSALFQEDLDILVAGISGLDCVLSGLAVTGGADMTPAVAKGAVLSNGTLFAVAAADVTIAAAHATLPRLDLIVVDSAGALAVRAGTAAAQPKPTARSANDVVLAMVYVPATDTAIASSQIVDKRVLRAQGPIVVYKTTAPETTNTTAAAVHVLNKAGSGVTIPSGLFLAGRQLRCRIGGNLLLNSGAPTVTLTISYGGTTLFADVTGAATADVDRLVFTLDFVLTAQANNDQALVGDFALSILGAKTAPTTGLGDIAGTAQLTGPYAGAAAVDSDAANRVLAVTLTMSVSNAANEIVVEHASLELL
jgi:hypothetical protein